MRGVIFLSGLILGELIGIFVMAGPTIQFAFSCPILFLVAICVFSFIGGLLLGVATRPKSKKLPLAGRVFEFPQGPLMVEIALKRMKSLRVGT